jgi:hypothetical protein
MEPTWHREQRLLMSHHGQRVSWRTSYPEEFPVIIKRLTPPMPAAVTDWAQGFLAARPSTKMTDLMAMFPMFTDGEITELYERMLLAASWLAEERAA